MKQVILTEKRSVAEDIVKALELEVRSRTDDNGFLRCSNEDGDEVVVVWSNGHCLCLPEPAEIDEKYKKWCIDDLPLPITDDAALNVIPDKRKLFYGIRSELLEADTVVNAGDAGREGELIQRWIISKVFGKHAPPVSRLWIQSLTAKAIREGYRNLLGRTKPEKKRLDALYDAGRARAIMDMYIGYNYSRLISLTQTRWVTVSYGRCQSPLVHAIVERDREIDSFVVREYQYLTAGFEKDGQEFTATLVEEDLSRVEWFREEGEEEEQARVMDRLSDLMTVKEVRKKKKYVSPPGPYDTLQLQKIMAKRYDFAADDTLAILEDLYNKYHILSYPRTDARYFTEDMREELNSMLEKLHFGKFRGIVEAAQSGEIPDRYFNDGKIADHHALCPVSEGDLEKVYNRLYEEEQKVFDAVLENFIALFLPNYEYESIDVLLEGEGTLLRAKGKRVLQDGWKLIDRGTEEEDDSEHEQVGTLPELKAGEILSVCEYLFRDGKTKPKEHFTIPSLLDYMRVYHIGTGATRDRIINELTRKKGHNGDSAIRKSGKHYLATELGKRIDSVIPDHIKSIDYLKHLEEGLQNIAEGKLEIEHFLAEMQDRFRKDQAALCENCGERIWGTGKVKIIDGVRCPVCGADLKDVEWGWACCNWKKDGSGCAFSIRKKQYGKTLSQKAITQLICDGRTKKKLSGLKGKKGKAFDAWLTLEIDEDTGEASVRCSFGG